MTQRVHGTDTRGLDTMAICHSRVPEVTLKPALPYSAFQKVTEKAGDTTCSEDEAWAEQEPLQATGEEAKLTPSGYGHWMGAGAGARLETCEAIWTGRKVQWVEAKGLTS